MAGKKAIEDFVSLNTFAIVGVSRGGKKFGNITFRELTSHGYKLYPIHPLAEILEGVPAYKNFASLPEKVDGVIIIVPPAQTELVIREASAAGIRRVWMQQGAESDSAISFCQANGIVEIHGHCINMFAHNTSSYHKFHRGILKLFGKLPR
jgi:predicted CoA-binding protein